MYSTLPCQLALLWTDQQADIAKGESFFLNLYQNESDPEIALLGVYFSNAFIE